MEIYCLTNNPWAQGRRAPVITKLPEREYFLRGREQSQSFFWKFKKLNSSSKNRESYFLLYITTALREFPWNHLGEETDLVLSLALKNRSGYRSWSTWTCYLGVPIYPILFYSLPVCVCPSQRITWKTNV